MQIAPAAMKLFSTLVVSISLCAVARANPSSSRVPDGLETVAVTSGELHVPGLERPVRVLRDRWGVAHIYAGNQHDLFFAQGVVAAQDRLFQMELWKRAGQGRLSEILGPSALPRDIDARALKYRGDLQKEYESYSPDTLAILTAFTDGINAYIAHARSAGRLRTAHRIHPCGIPARQLAPAGLPESHGGLLDDRQCGERAQFGAGADGSRSG